MNMNVPRTFRILAAVTLLCAVHSNAADAPVARAGKIMITESELAAAVAGQVLQLHKQEYEIKRGVLDHIIEQKVLYAEGVRRGLTVEKLIQLEVSDRVPTPTDGEAEAFYLAQMHGQTPDGRPSSEALEMARNSLRAMREKQRRAEFVRQLREEAGVTILLEPPRIDVSYDQTRLRGKAEAPVTIVEFSDFQCPYCFMVQSSLKTLLEKYNGKVKLAFRDFPLSQMHPFAQLAAEASRCAADQAKFWPYHDLLFENQKNLAVERLKEYAVRAELDAQQFDNCLESRKYRPAVEADVEAGRKVGVVGTPAFFVNGQFLGGVQQSSAFEELIEEELSRKAAPH